MTIGISKERLFEKLSDLADCRDIKSHEKREYLKTLILDCTELNTWLPIDESTPKDRQVLLYVDKGPESYRQWVGYADNNWPWLPTHWQELPADPD